MNVTTTASAHGFLDELREQRWDDHRYYHRHRVNQALHLLSALCFLTAYALVPTRPIAAAIFGWVIAMWPRQIGHVWFEPREYDDVNQATFAHKEAIKVGFNLRRKAALFAVDAYFAERGGRLPVWVSGTITDLSGRTLSGQTTEASSIGMVSAFVRNWTLSSQTPP